MTTLTSNCGIRYGAPRSLPRRALLTSVASRRTSSAGLRLLLRLGARAARIPECNKPLTSGALGRPGPSRQTPNLQGAVTTCGASKRRTARRRPMPPRPNVKHKPTFGGGVSSNTAYHRWFVRRCRCAGPLTLKFLHKTLCCTRHLRHRGPFSPVGRAEVGELERIVPGPLRISTVIRRPRALTRPRTTASATVLGLGLRPSTTTLSPTANATMQALNWQRVILPSEIHHGNAVQSASQLLHVTARERV